MTIIIPTVGRVVWFRQRGINEVPAQPFVAHVTYVHSHRMVNLITFDYNGNMHPASSVPLVQEDDAIDPSWTQWCEWMPWQVGQAKKHENEEKKDAPVTISSEIKKEIP